MFLWPISGELVAPKAEGLYRDCSSSSTDRACLALLITSGSFAVAGGVATAAPTPPPPPPPPIDLPAGFACEGFDLRIQFGQPFPEAREFYDENGNLVRTMSTGRGVDLTFTNLDTGATYNLRANGSNSRTTIDPVTGIATVTATGHNVIVLFPTDVPAGPSTTLFTGQVQYTVAPDGVFTLTKTAGRTVDICAQLV